jgi:uncharacterized coiled-coil DUF342 family protein
MNEKEIELFRRLTTKRIELLNRINAKIARRQSLNQEIQQLRRDVRKVDKQLNVLSSG